MMKFAKHFLILICIFSTSCRMQSVSDSTTHPLVAAILSDKALPEYGRLASHTEPSINGDIYLIGGEKACKALSSVLLNYDAHNNVTGRHVPDGLPDFAGETVAMVIDDAAFPYWDFIQENGQEKMREHFLRLALSSLDTLSNLSVYDLEGKGRRDDAKIIIIADPYYLSWGKKDVDFLFENTLCRVPVLQPSDLLFEKLFSDPPAELNVGILCDSVFTRSSVYTECLKAQAGRPDVGSFAASPVAGKSALFSFLDLYRTNGGRAPINVLLVDDPTVDMDSLNKDLVKSKNLNRPEYLTYGKLLSDDLRIIESSDVVSDFCYSFLREYNLFTHKIAYPKLVSFRTSSIPDSESQDFLILQSDDVQD